MNYTSFYQCFLCYLLGYFDSYNFVRFNIAFYSKILDGKGGALCGKCLMLHHV